MAVQGLLFKTPGLISSCRFLLNTRLPQFTQAAGIKKEVADSLKKLKIPEKPKKPLTPYFRFSQEQRPAIVNEHPDWKITQIAVQLAADWKKIDPCSKERYENEYKSDMEQYAKKYLQYTSSLTEEQKRALEEYKEEVKRSKERRERKKKGRESGKPKKPVGAYMLYVMEEAKQQPDKTYPQLMAELKEKWAALPEGDKARYTLPVAKARIEYQQELKEWEEHMICEGNLDAVRRTTLFGKDPKPRSKKKESKESQEVSDEKFD